MEHKFDEFFYDSSNSINKIHAKIIMPDNIDEIKGVIQFSHGMCEYIEKYSNFIDFVISNGYVFACNDHLGHGSSLKDDTERGFFASKDGYKYMVEDVHKLTQIVKKKFPPKPYFLLGHSMGSFIARCYAANYGYELNGLMLCGTIGPQWMVDAGIQLADTIIKRKGPLYRSKKLDRLSFEFANINFEPIKTKYDWTCSDEEVVKAHAADKKANFIFTVSGFKDLFYLVKLCNEEKFIRNTPKDLPIFIFSGSMDPVGENGVGVKKVYELYKKIGIKELEFKLYEGKRHEMLNETNKLEVYNDILNWMDVVKFVSE